MPSTVRETFDQLRQHLTHDIDQLLTQPEGGNYAAALLVAIGSEALSRLQGFRDGKVFVDLMTKHGLPGEMGSDVFRALRHGIAHVYDTRYIESGKLKIELVVSWGQRKHLTVRRVPPGLYLNVRTMWDDLRGVLAMLDAGLPPGGSLPARWVSGTASGCGVGDLDYGSRGGIKVRRNCSGAEEGPKPIDQTDPGFFAVRV